MKWLPKFLILFLVLITSALADTFAPRAGTIKVVSKNDELCTDGPYQIVGEKGAEVLMVGANITFYLPSQKKEVLSRASETECAEDVVSSYANDTLTNVFSTHSCPKKLKHLERKVVEKLVVSDKTIKYTKESPKEKKVECVFKWTQHEKK